MIATPRIEGYDFGRILIDGNEQTRDLIVLPARVVTNRWRAEGHRLVLADLDEVPEELPAHLVVGTGAYGQMCPDPETVEQLRKRGVEVEASGPVKPSAATESSTRAARRLRST